jgi:tRNA/rRNA methyltransferase
MNTPNTDTSVFSALRIVLVETSHPGNIGAAARAMKTMGFSDLVLVNPRFPDAVSQEEAIAFASSALDVLSGARIVGSIDEALEGCRFAAAVTSRLREFSPPILTARALACQLAATPGRPTALVFGNERYGLPNEIVEKCNALINIPANPDYSSLNLAQAVQVLTYECRMALLGDKLPDTDIGFRGELATIADIEGVFAHFEEALTRIEFLNPHTPKKMMPRLRRLFARAGLEVEEVNILRGIARQILLKTGR